MTFSLPGTGVRRGAATILLLATLSACTFYKPPPPYLPARNGIEAGETITVQGDQNVYAIARRHNVSMRDLIVLNDLQPPFDVKPGQSLVLPATGNSFSGGMPAPEPAPLAPVEQRGLAPVEPAAVSSQPLGSVGQTATAPLTDAPAPLSNATSAPVPLTPVAPSPAPRAMTTGEPVAALSRPLPPQRQVATTMTPPVASAAVGATAAPVAAHAAAPDMIWPVQGPILSGFGAKGPGLTNDGVNIGAPKGAPVVAAASGTVVYAGNEMKGFGNLVLIRHQDNWVTAYAHLDRVLVRKDSIVAQGDMIGTVGGTGNVASPQLHFETRYGGKAVDPAGVVKGNAG